MTEELNLALQLLIVGMVSVFTILGIVVGLGKLLIGVVNKYSPEVVETKKVKRQRNVFSPKKLAAITAVVDHIILQQGVIKSVKKL